MQTRAASALSHRTAANNTAPQSFVDNSTLCLGHDKDGAPYGMDPVLLSTSSIYNGKVTYASAYRAGEKASASTASTASLRPACSYVLTWAHDRACLTNSTAQPLLKNELNRY